jgi:adenylate cyclase
MNFLDFHAPRYRKPFGMGLAFIELGRFDEAIVGRREPHVCPLISVAYHCLASAFAHLGRDGEAREDCAYA